jgi:hypothetical protein
MPTPCCPRTSQVTASLLHRSVSPEASRLLFLACPTVPQANSHLPVNSLRQAAEECPPCHPFHRVPMAFLTFPPMDCPSLLPAVSHSRRQVLLAARPRAFLDFPECRLPRDSTAGFLVAPRRLGSLLVLADMPRGRTGGNQLGKSQAALCERRFGAFCTKHWFLEGEEKTVKCVNYRIPSTGGQSERSINSQP